MDAWYDPGSSRFVTGSTAPGPSQTGPSLATGESRRLCGQILRLRIRDISRAIVFQFGALASAGVVIPRPIRDLWNPKPVQGLEGHLVVSGVFRPEPLRAEDHGGATPHCIVAQGEDRVGYFKDPASSSRRRSTMPSKPCISSALVGCSSSHPASMRDFNASRIADEIECAPRENPGYEVLSCLPLRSEFSGGNQILVDLTAKHFGSRPQ